MSLKHKQLHSWWARGGNLSTLTADNEYSRILGRKDSRAGSASTAIQALEEKFLQFS